MPIMNRVALRLCVALGCVCCTRSCRKSDTSGSQRSNRSIEGPRYVYTTGVGGIVVQDVERSQTGQVTGVRCWVDGTLTADGTCLLFSVQSVEESGIWSLPSTILTDLRGRSAAWSEVRMSGRRLTDGKLDRFPALSPDGRRLVFVRNGGLSVLDVETGRIRGIGESREYFAHVAPNRYLGDLLPSWSPEGDRIAYTHAEEGEEPQIWVVRADGSERRQLTSGHYGTHSALWGKSGKVLAALRNTLPTDPSSPVGDVARGQLIFLDAGTGQALASWPCIGAEELVSWRPDANQVVIAAGENMLDISVATFTAGWRGDGLSLRVVSRGRAGGVFVSW